MKTLEAMRETPFVANRLRIISQYRINQRNFYRPVVEAEQSIIDNYNKCVSVLPGIENDSRFDKETIRDFEKELSDCYKKTSDKSDCYNKIINTIDDILSYMYYCVNNQEIEKILDFCDDWDELKGKYDYFQLRDDEEEIYEEELEDDDYEY